MAEGIDSLAQEIRRVDGAHSLGAGALAEALQPWLAAHDREVAAKALRDAADRIDRHPWGDYLMATPGGLLRVLADRIESQASEKGSQ